MRTPGTFVASSYNIHVKSLGRPIYLVPFGDVHFGIALHATDEFNEFCARYKGRKDCWFLGMGDYCDWLSSTEREVWDSTKKRYHENTIKRFEQNGRKLTEAFADKIRWMRGRLIGLIEGNHYAEFSDGTTSTQQLCRILDTTYLGTSGVVRVGLENNGQRTSIQFWAHHGLGAGRRSGSSLNRLEDMADKAEGVDVFLQGHDHKRGTWHLDDRLCFPFDKKNESMGVKSRSRLACRTGSFLKAYVSGEESYNVDADRSPCNLGNIEVEITLQRVQRPRVIISEDDGLVYQDSDTSRMIATIRGIA